MARNTQGSGESGVMKDSACTEGEREAHRLKLPALLRVRQSTKIAEAAAERLLIRRSGRVRKAVRDGFSRKNPAAMSRRQ